MSMMVAVAPIKVDAETDRLVASAAHFLQRSKKDVVDAAVREYVEAHRDEIQNAAIENLRLLDGTARGGVKLLTGASDDEIDALGGLKK
jgi:predicted transcriptional regulator